MFSIVEIIIVIVIVTIAWMTGFAMIQKTHEERGEQSYTCVDSACYKKEFTTNKNFDEKTIVAVEKTIPKPEPVVVKEEVVENHYHFKELNAGLMAFAGLGGFALFAFIFYKLLGVGRTSFVIAKARKKSEQLLAEFDIVLDDIAKSIAYNKKIVEQVAFNNLLLEAYKGNPATSSLIVSNHMMKDKLIFIERKLLNDFKN